MSTCIYCLEEAEKDNPLLQNQACSCNYHYHLQCMLHFAPDTCPLCRISHSQNEPQVMPVNIIEVQEQPVRGRGTNRMAQIVLTVYCCTIIVFIVISAARIIPEL